MGLLSREHPKAQPGRLLFVVVFWRSQGSNLRPLVYKASDLTTSPRRLMEKHAHPPRVVYCAIYLTLTLITKFRVSNLHITTR